MNDDFISLAALFQRARYCFDMSFDRESIERTTGNGICTRLRRSLKVACLQNGYRGAEVSSEFVPGTDCQHSALRLPSADPTLLRFDLFVCQRFKFSPPRGLIAVQMEVLTFPGEERSLMDRTLMPIRATSLLQEMPSRRLTPTIPNRPYAMGVYFLVFTANRLNRARYYWRGAVIHETSSQL